MNRPVQLNDKPVQPVENEILQYLINNPKAQDTVEGIVDWWLLPKKYKRALVEAALARLVKAGLVIKQERSGSQTYKMNRRRRKEVISRLQQRS
jgi:predicted transcriptional regulator